MVKKVKNKSDYKKYHTYTTQCLEKGCGFYVVVGDKTGGTKFYKGSGKLYASTELAGHKALHPDHLTVLYDETDFCSKGEEYIEPHVRKDGTYVRGYCKKVK